MTVAATIDRLVVIHRPHGGDAVAPADGRHALRLVTCLREVVVDLRGPGPLHVPAPAGGEVREGTAAYRLLLEIATGLHSEIPGETNVFGQFRRAWRAFTGSGQPALAAALAPVIARLFADTKTVRRHWLQGIGGHSYGSLVRRLIDPRPGDRVLFVGHGDLMRSMRPLFDRYRVGLWNRGPLNGRDAADLVFAPERGPLAAGWADHAILTTPADPANDARWRAWLGAARPRSVVHLGHRDTGWFAADRTADELGVYGLDDVFRLRHALADRRAVRLDRARTACAALAAACDAPSGTGLRAA